MLKGASREPGKAWSSAVFPLQHTWGSGVKWRVMGKQQCAEDGVLPQTTCVGWRKKALRGEEMLICHGAHWLPGRGDVGAMLLT